MFPRLGASPGRWAIVAPLLLLSAWILLLPSSADPWNLIPGDPSYPDVPNTLNIHWTFHQEGIVRGASSRLLGWPLALDRVILHGFSLDAFCSEPFVKLLGFSAGFTFYLIAVQWALGLAMAWLAGRWWRSSFAGLVAGVALQASSTTTFELSEGRSSQVFALIFFPLFLGLAVRAISERRISDSILAALCFSAATLTWWFSAALLGLGLAVLVVLALIEGIPSFKPVFRVAAFSLVLLGLPLIYTFIGRGSQPGIDADAWTLIQDRVGSVPLAVLVKDRSLNLESFYSGVHSLHPVAALLILFSMWHTRGRRWIAPLAWLLLGAWLAIGPWIDLRHGVAIPQPFWLVLHTPLLKRWWWPVRALMLAAPAMALFMGGGAAHLREMLGKKSWLLAPLPALILAESFLLLPQLPLLSTPGTPSEQAQVIMRGQGPALILPHPSGVIRKEADPLLDQVFHKRPLANGMMSPDSSNAPLPLRLLHSSDPTLAHLLACEHDDDSETELVETVAYSQLRALGIRQIYVDKSVITLLPGDGELYLACLKRVLGEEADEEPPYLVFQVP